MLRVESIIINSKDDFEKILELENRSSEKIFSELSMHIIKEVYLSLKWNSLVLYNIQEYSVTENKDKEYIELAKFIRKHSLFYHSIFIININPCNSNIKYPKDLYYDEDDITVSEKDKNILIPIEHKSELLKQGDDLMRTLGFHWIDAYFDNSDENYIYSNETDIKNLVNLLLTKKKVGD